MARSKPIHRAIAEVLAGDAQAMSPQEIYDRICERQLYSFPAKDPVHVVRSTLRRHCVNMAFPSARDKKYFTIDTDGKYQLLPRPVAVEATAFKTNAGGRKKGERIVVVPLDDAGSASTAEGGSRHTEIQYRLCDLGRRLGYSVWAPAGDRSLASQGRRIETLPKMLERLPPQFEPNAMRIVSYIDVIWLENRSMFAAFEVEHSTPIYSGLLRMADLMTLVPNQELKWFVVASGDRFDKFAREVSRPMFKDALRRPLHSICRFLSYERLLEQLDKAEEFLDDLKMSFLERISEAYDPTEAFDE